MFPLLAITLSVIYVWSAAQLPNDTTDNQQVARRLFQETLAARPTLALKKYIVQLERVTVLDSKFTEAFYQLGCAYIELGTIEGRNHATEALERARQLAPQNIEYRYGLAKLYWQREMKPQQPKNFVGLCRSIRLMHGPIIIWPCSKKKRCSTTAI